MYTLEIFLLEPRPPLEAPWHGASLLRLRCRTIPGHELAAWGGAVELKFVANFISATLALFSCDAETINSSPNYFSVATTPEQWTKFWASFQPTLLIFYNLLSHRCFCFGQILMRWKQMLWWQDAEQKHKTNWFNNFAMANNRLFTSFDASVPCLEFLHN